MTAKKYRQRIWLRKFVFWSLIVLTLLIASFSVGRFYEKSNECFCYYVDGDKAIVIKEVK